MSSEANRSPLAHHPMHSPWNAARGERVPACYDFKPKNEKTSMGRSNGSRDRCRSRGTARGTAPFFLVLFSLHLHTGISIPEKASPSASYSYFRKNEKRYFHNKADYQAMAWLLKSFRSNDFCNSTNSSTIVIGGTNKGELAYAAAKGCVGAKIIGFDVQRSAIKMAKQRLAGYAGRIRLIHQGWSDTSGSMTLSTPWDGSEVASLFDATGSKDVEGSRKFSKKWLLRRTVNVTTLAIVGNSTRELQNGALYVLIDTEGHEPRVIRGMELAREENQARYPLFQYEVGATWGRLDPRHHNDSWTEEIAARHLHDCGYDVFLIGTCGWLWVDSDFFALGGAVTPIDGNVLAMHRKFAPALVKQDILARSCIGSSSS